MSNANEANSKALRKVVAAVQGLGQQAVAIGAIAHQAWGSKREAPSVEVLTSSNSEKRESLLSAVRGEGLQQSPGSPLHLRYTDAKLGVTAVVDIVESSTPFHSKVISRAERADVLSTPMLLATCEDLILLASEHAVRVDLLRRNAGRIDGAYLKREAEAAGVFDKVKLAWQEAKQA